ncbi:MAG TPA: GNAT family N-acetyltransferase [Candidatus Nitrosopolaris sp.]|nr:GNAT family N-acetyltransferase [Candidatus Nitrosopolaris sp.]
MKDAPYAFGSTWERERDRPEVDWRRAVESRERYVVELDGRTVGTASGGESGFSRAASLTSLWVDPSARGQGVGDLLITTVMALAKGAGSVQLMLWVTEGNTHAEGLYKRHGFRRTGAIQPVRAGDDRLEFEMSVLL